MLARCLLLIAFLVPLPAPAQPQVHFILSDDAQPYHAVYNAAARMLDPQASTSMGLYTEAPPDTAEILVTLGTRATHSIATSDDPRPVFAGLVPYRSWQAVRAAIPPCSGPRNVLYLDQPLTRQLAFIRTLLPPVRTLGIAYGPASSSLADALQQAAGDYSFHLVTMHSRDAESPTDLVAQILRRSEVLLALPDSEVYNRYSVQAVLLTSFRLRRPVIGFSKAWVNAGALGAVYSGPSQIGREIGDWVRAYMDGEPGNTERWPRRFSLEVNREVAYSLGLTIPPDSLIRQQVMLLEGPR